MDAMVRDYGIVEEKLLVAVDLLLDVESIRHQGMPVVEGVELRRDTVLVLEALVEQQFRVEF